MYIIRKYGIENIPSIECIYENKSTGKCRFVNLKFRITSSANGMEVTYYSQLLCYLLRTRQQFIFFVAIFIFIFVNISARGGARTLMVHIRVRRDLECSQSTCFPNAHNIYFTDKQIAQRREKNFS